jgi:hypothetical protein
MPYAPTVANEPLVGEHERSRRIGGRGRPYSEPNRDQSGDKGKQGSLAHLVIPFNQLNRNMRSSSRLRGAMPNPGFE